MLSFFSGPARKAYEPSVLNLVFRLLKSVHQEKKPQQTKPPVLPHTRRVRHVHPTTTSLVSGFLHNAMCPHTYRQPLSIQPLSSVGFCWQHSGLQTKETAPRFHEFLGFPTTASLPCHCPRAAASFPWNIFPWLYLISSSALCSP